MNNQQEKQASKQASRLDEVFVALARDPLTNELSLQKSLDHIAKTCATRMEVSRASIWLLNQSHSLDCMSLYASDTDSHESTPSISVDSFPSYFSALEEHRVVDASNVKTDPRTSALAESYFIPMDIKSTLDATLRHEGSLQGVIALEQKSTNRIWTREEQVFVSSIAELVSQRILMEKMRASEARYRALFNGTGDCIFVLTDGVFSDCNEVALRVFRCNRDELIGSSPIEISPTKQPDGRPSTESSQKRVNSALNGNIEVFEWRHKRIDGTEFDAEVTLSAISLNGATSLTGIVRDITNRKRDEEALRLSREQLEYRALHDSLTGLPNRDKLHDETPEVIGRAKQEKSKAALILLDLNRFKEVNDTFGHSTGDQLLKHLAKHLAKAIHSRPAKIYRLGGDEFVVLVEQITNQEDALDAAEELSSSLLIPMRLKDIQIELGASFGIAVYPDHGESSHELLRSADVAMYHAKFQGMPLSIYNPEYDFNTPRRLALISELGNAIRENELRLFYQPRINMETGKCTGCEALIRWQHPKMGLIMPDDFIVAAEMSNNIHPLSEWVARNALHQAQLWLDSGKEMLISINLSARNLTDRFFPLKLSGLLDEFSVPPHLLEIEITESSLISDPLRARNMLQEIDNLGVRIAIDDFGTGYSSLQYLNQLPLRALKIDRTFVQDMLTNDSNAKIVRSVIDLAHNFALEVVAEGVESKKTMDALSELSCDSAQGFHFARPLPIDKFEEWLQHFNKD